MWLRGNRRVVLAGMVVPAVVACASALLATGALGWPTSGWARGIAWAVAAVSLLGLAALAWQWKQPRLAREGNELLVYLRRGAPIRVPLDVVECFLMGHSASFLRGPKHARSHTSTIVVRLAERAEAWHERSVEPVLGSWCDGHIVIRGTWCEPLSLEVVDRLNRRLAEAHRETVKAAE